MLSQINKNFVASEPLNIYAIFSLVSSTLSFYKIYSFLGDIKEDFDTMTELPFKGTNIVYHFGYIHYIFLGNILFSIASFFPQSKSSKRILYGIAFTGGSIYATWLCNSPDISSWSDNFSANFNLLLIRALIAFFSTMIMYSPLFLVTPQINERCFKVLEEKKSKIPEATLQV